MRRLLLLVLLCAFPLVLGMGSGDVSSTGEMPKATKNYNVTIVDDTGAKTDASNFTCEGKLYFEGKKGAGKVSVSFDKVRELAVEKKAGVKGERAVVNASLADGGSFQFEMECRDRCSGNTGFGSFSIDMCDVKKITFK